MIKDLILQIKATQTAATQVRELRNELTTLIREAERIAKTSSKSTAGMDKTSQAATKQAQTIDKLNRVLEKSLKAISSLQIKNRELEKGLRGVASSAEKGAVAMNTLGNSVVQAKDKMRGGNDQMKMLTRTTTAGFKAMMISQAAWLAGFSLIFGPLYKFGELIKEAIDIDNQFARSVRVLRSENEDTGAALAEAYSAMTYEMARTGSGAKEVSEVLYQLGSAGLTTQEAMAALSSTMDIIVGTEADITNVTKLVAGVYNNVKDSIMRAADGTIVFVGANTQLQDQLKNNVTQTEKFVAINDVLVTAFDQHQVEMSELVDGLKYAISTTIAAGMSFTELTGVLVTLNDHMVKAGTAGRSFQSLVARIAADSQKFATAFNIKIDASAPLDMMDILRQLHENIDSSYYSVEELGLMFQRTGLRGAKSMAILVKYYDELIKNTKELETGSQGAARRMAEVMIETPARSLARLNQALILVTKAIIAIPVFVFFELIKAINCTVVAAMELNKALGGIPGYLFAIGAAVTGVYIILAAIRMLVVTFPIVESAVWGVLIAFKAFEIGGVAAIFTGIAASANRVKLAFLGLIQVITFLGDAIAGGIIATFGVLGAWIIAIVAALGLAYYAWTQFSKGAKIADGVLKDVQKGMSASQRQTEASNGKIVELMMSTYDLIDANKELHGIDLGTAAENVGAKREMQLIEDKITQSYLGRSITLGKEFAITEEIYNKRVELAELAGEELALTELGKNKQQDLTKALQTYKEKFQDVLDSYDELIKKITTTTELAQEFADFATTLKFNFKIYEAVVNGIGNADDAYRDFTVGMAANMTDSVIAQISQLNRLFNQVSAGGNVSLEEFIGYWKRVSKIGPEAVGKIWSQMEKLRESIKKSEEGLRAYAREFASLNISAVKDITSIWDAIGMGPKGAVSLVSEAEKSGKEVKDLTEKADEARKALDELQRKALEGGVSYDDIAKAMENCAEAEDELSKATENDTITRQRANDSVIIATQLINREKAAISSKMSLLQSQASIYRESASVANATFAEREAAFTSEFENYKELSQLQIDLNNKELEALDIKYAQREISQSEYYAQQFALATKSQGALEALDRKREQAQTDMMGATKGAQEEQKAQLKALNEMYQSLIVALNTVADRLSFLNFKTLPEDVSAVFVIAEKAIQDLLDTTYEYKDLLDTLCSASYVINVTQKTTETRKVVEEPATPMEETRGSSEGYYQYGGLINTASRTFVSAGEGFMAPQYVRKNLPTLQALNAGNAVPIRGGAFPMSRFVGPSGIDNIETSLPRGSFVVSRKGMQAFERATKAISERQNYQTGGIVGGNAEPNITAASSKPEDKAMFELTLSLGNGGKRSYPLYGTHSVVKEIKDHLERENLTKL